MRLKCCIIFVFSVLLGFYLNAQTYGLRFLSHEVVKEKRTSLNLSFPAPLCLKGETAISFDLALVPEMETYFGYVFRVIVDNENIDLVYDQKTVRFNCVVGEKLLGTFNIDSLKLFHSWNNIQVKLNANTHSASFFAGGKPICSGAVKFNGCFRIFFGANNFDEFQTADVPPMRIKDIKITEDGNVAYNWPLDEMAGNKTADIAKKKVADVINPVWIKQQHQSWQLTNTLDVKGYPSIAFDAKHNLLYIVSQDSLYTIAAKNALLKATALSNKRDTMLPGNQSIFDTSTNSLYNFYIDQKKVTGFDFVANRWNGDFKTGVLTEFWQANKFISPSDTSLYIVDGYGQMMYKNMVQRYNLKTGDWSTMQTHGDFFAPRYLAGLGANKAGDTAYIIGGYGSNTGSQVLNPKYYYDLYLYDVKRAAFKNIYHLQEPANQFCFANSLVLDPETKSFYALIYPNNRFNSSLQLIQGSLTHPEYRLMGDTIPYNFYDVGSFCDLYYSEAEKKLIAVTIYASKDNLTNIKVYNIGFPPNIAISNATTENGGISKIWMAIAGIGLLGAMYFVFKVKRSKKVKKEAAAEPPKSTSLAHAAVFENAGTTEEKQQQADEVVSPVEKLSQVLFFGQFTVVDSEGEDLTKLFTPLLKELFLIIAIYTIKNGNGISSSQLYSTLWSGKSNKDAQNNRSVNMVKLKTIIDKLGRINIVKEGDRWALQYEIADMYIDFAEFLTLTEKANVDIYRLLAIVKKGALLQGTEYEWLDDIKSDVAGKIIDILHAAVNTHASNYELLTEIANSIFFFDPVNEEALHIKCRSLSLLGRHSLAKSTYNKFLKDYHHMYGEDYKETFQDVIA